MSANRKNFNGVEECSVHEHFERFTEEFDRFAEQNRDHQHQLKETVDKVDTMHNAIADIHKDTKHLSVLPTIADEIKQLRTQAFEVATGKRHVPLATHLLTIGVFAVILLLVIAERFSTSMEFTEKGFRIKRESNVLDQR